MAFIARIDNNAICNTQLGICFFKCGSPLLFFIQNFNITYDMDTKEVVEWTLDFAADGVFYSPGDNVQDHKSNAQGPKTDLVA